MVVSRCNGEAMSCFFVLYRKQSVFIVPSAARDQSKVTYQPRDHRNLATSQHTVFISIGAEQEVYGIASDELSDHNVYIIEETKTELENTKCQLTQSGRITERSN